MVSRYETNTYCDNHSVLDNMTQVESDLDKNISSVAYHYVRYAAVENIITMEWIKTRYNTLEINL